VENIWDDDYEGNYWGDYLTRYPNATEIPGTGTGNTPFVINENNVDNHPLLNPAGSLPPLFQSSRPSQSNSTPTTSPSPSTNPTTSLTPNLIPTDSAVQKPTVSPIPTTNGSEAKDYKILIILYSSIAVAVAVGLRVYFRKRRERSG
jgi:hypothetical protein